jgi:hypothetical protein
MGVGFVSLNRLNSQEQENPDATAMPISSAELPPIIVEYHTPGTFHCSIASQYYMFDKKVKGGRKRRKS